MDREADGSLCFLSLKKPFIAEFFAVAGGKTREIHAVIAGVPQSAPSGW